MTRRMIALFTVSLVVVAMPVRGGILSIDTGANEDPAGNTQTVQAGWAGFSGNRNTSGTFSQNFATPMATSGTLTVELRTVSGWRDRTNAAVHTIGDVVEDMVYANTNLGMGLIGLKAGTYYFRSYNHDTGFSQGPIDVKMSDAVATSRLMYAGLAQTAGTGTGSVNSGMVRTVPLIFRANGTNEVAFSWTKMGTATNNAVLAGFEFTDTLPADLKVDIGAAAQQVQAGWEPLVGNDGTSPQGHWYFSEMGNLGSVSAKLSVPQEDMGFRVRSGVTHSLGDMLEDLAFGRSKLDLSLGSLLPGRYLVTTYHHDSQFPRGTLDISVSDALGTARLMDTLGQSAGTAPASVASSTFEVYSDGVKPVVVRVAKNTADVAVLSGFQVVPLDALRVDFAGTSATNDVQHGFVPFNRTVNQNTTGLQSETYATGLSDSGQVTVSIRGADNVLSWRDRGDVLNPDLGDVAEDFVFDEQSIDMALGGLRQGQFLMSAYFHDKGFDHGSVDILVSDALGLNRLVAQDIVMPSGDSTPGTASFAFFSDGSTPVSFRFQEHDSASFVMLTGFAVSEIVPEPASLTLAALALGGLGGYLRRRRR